MKQTALRTLALIAVLAAVSGCQSGPRFAWWKHDKAPEDTSTVARSATTPLPSAQATPQAVAIAGLTPAASPSSTNLAAASGATGATATSPASGALAASMPPAAPSVSIPVTSSTTVANAPVADYQAENALADKLVSTPNTKSAAVAPPAAHTMTPAAAAATQAAVPAAGPYDPNAYKPAAALASANANSPTSPVADRYGLSSASPSPAAVPAPASAQRSRVIRLTDMVRRPRSQRRRSRPPPHHSRIRQRWLPIDTRIRHCLRLPSKSTEATAASAPSTPATLSAGSIASAPGQYRPGRTSSYTSAAATSPIEVATRPAPPTTLPQHLPQQRYRTRRHEPALVARKPTQRRARIKLTVPNHGPDFGTAKTNRKRGIDLQISRLTFLWAPPYQPITMFDSIALRACSKSEPVSCM